MAVDHRSWDVPAAVASNNSIVINGTNDTMRSLKRCAWMRYQCGVVGLSVDVIIWVGIDTGVIFMSVGMNLEMMPKAMMPCVKRYCIL